MKLIIAAILLFTSQGVQAAGRSWSQTSNGYRLEITDMDSGLDDALINRLVQVFFEVYPKEVGEFNSAAPRTIKFVFDPNDRGVAGTAGDTVVFSAPYFKKNPKDVDVVTHEAMHVVQAYKSYDSGWLVEGIADYARDKYGVANAEAGWSLPKYAPKQKHTNGYGVTAAFLKYVEQRHPGTVKGLDSALRAGNYGDDSTWRKLTGKSVSANWSDYVENSNSGAKSSRRGHGGNRQRGRGNRGRGRRANRNGSG